MSRPMGAARRHPLIPRREVDPQQQLPALELEVLGRWRERDVFAESLRRRAGGERWVFYEGPPTANGPPGTHHVLSRVFKDIYPRFQTMRGRYVERKGGWDCHGLPVEIAVEQKLGITSKAQIEEEVGIERFNAECRASVFAFLEDWNRLTERIGFWLDLEGAYRTLDETYIESVWWALAADPRARAAVRGPQGGALLPPLRDHPVLARGGARLPRRGGPERVPEAARAGGPGAAAGVDDDALDAARERGPGGGPGGDLRARERRRRAARAGRGEGRGGARGGARRGARAPQRQRAGGALRRLRGADLHGQRPRAGTAADPGR